LLDLHTGVFLHAAGCIDVVEFSQQHSFRSESQLDKTGKETPTIPEHVSAINRVSLWCTSVVGPEYWEARERRPEKFSYSGMGECLLLDVSSCPFLT
jgi:hypothetical protein